MAQSLHRRESDGAICGVEGTDEADRRGDQHRTQEDVE
jgi:hypothetical protein